MNNFFILRKKVLRLKNLKRKKQCNTLRQELYDCGAGAKVREG